MADDTPRPRLGAWQAIHENERYSVYRVEADFGAFAKVYYPSDHKPRVGLVVPRPGDGVGDAPGPAVMMVRQYRLLLDGPSLELPGGKVDEGETPEQAALRECREETGLRCTRVERLVHYLPGMDNLLNHTDVFVALDAEETGEFEVDAGEVVERRWVPLDEALSLVESGGIACGMTIMGLLTYARWLEKKR